MSDTRRSAAAWPPRKSRRPAAMMVALAGTFTFWSVFISTNVQTPTVSYTLSVVDLPAPTCNGGDCPGLCSYPPNCAS